MKKFTIPYLLDMMLLFVKEKHKKLLADHPKVKIHVEHRDTKYISPGGRTELVDVIIHALIKKADLCFADGSKTIRELMRTNPAPSSKRNSKRRNVMRKSKTLLNLLN